MKPQPFLNQPVRNLFQETFLAGSIKKRKFSSLKKIKFGINICIPLYIYICVCVCVHYVLCLITQLCLTLCDPMDCSPPGSSVHGDSPGKNTGVGCHALLQGIFPTQGSNPGLPQCRQILYYLSHQGSPIYTIYI